MFNYIKSLKNYKKINCTKNEYKSMSNYNKCTNKNEKELIVQKITTKSLKKKKEKYQINEKK